MLPMHTRDRKNVEIYYRSNDSDGVLGVLSLDLFLGVDLAVLKGVPK